MFLKLVISARELRCGAAVRAGHCAPCRAALAARWSQPFTRDTGNSLFFGRETWNDKYFIIVNVFVTCAGN